jgi:hypothetical protein
MGLRESNSNAVRLAWAFTFLFMYASVVSFIDSKPMASARQLASSRASTTAWSRRELARVYASQATPVFRNSGNRALRRVGGTVKVESNALMYCAPCSSR